MVLYCSGNMYKYYSNLEFSLIKHNEEGKDIYNKIFNNIPHLIKSHINVDFIQDGFIIYKNKAIIRQGEVITDLFQPKISPTFSFSGMYQKSFIYRRNGTNSR